LGSRFRKKSGFEKDPIELTTDKKADFRDRLRDALAHVI
jgi:hypothetical protein